MYDPITIRNLLVVLCDKGRTFVLLFSAKG
jgi:hypothetical protein